MQNTSGKNTKCKSNQIFFFFQFRFKKNKLLWHFECIYFAELKKKLHVAPDTHVAFRGELLPCFNSSCPKAHHKMNGENK